MKMEYAWEEFQRGSSYALALVVKWTNAAGTAAAEGARTAADIGGREWQKLAR